MTLQSLCICVEIFIAALVYVYMQFFPVSEVVIIVAHTCWILTHGEINELKLINNVFIGDTPIVYLLLNDSLRKAVFRMVRDFTTQSRITASNTGRIFSTNRTSQPVSPLPDILRTSHQVSPLPDIHAQ
jgi:hypothetical protein